MGKKTSSRESFSSAASAARSASRGAPVTGKAEQKAKETGELNPLVDPKGYGLIRESRPRFEEITSGPLAGKFRMTVGTPLAIEKRLDTTASMGDNVDRALEVMPHAFEYYPLVAPGYDVQLSFSTFNDIGDPIVLCRSQFEMEAEKIVAQLTYMIPCRDGGDVPEDPHYGLFGAAYLTSAYINRIGLKGYDFTITDAPARDLLDKRQLVRIYGDEVFTRCADNGHEIDAKHLPTTEEVVQALLKRAHAFVFMVSNRGDSRHGAFWKRLYGSNRVIELPNINLLPQVQTAVIGLTEGVLTLRGLKEYLRSVQTPDREIPAIERSLANIPIGAQASLPNYSKRPKADDIFETKQSLWPMSKQEIEKLTGGRVAENQSETDGGLTWL